MGTDTISILLRNRGDEQRKQLRVEVKVLTHGAELASYNMAHNAINVLDMPRSPKTSEHPNSLFFFVHADPEVKSLGCTTPGSRTRSSEGVPRDSFFLL